MPLVASIIFISETPWHWWVVGAESQENIGQDDKVKARAEYERREGGELRGSPACQRRE